MRSVSSRRAPARRGAADPRRRPHAGKPAAPPPRARARRFPSITRAFFAATLLATDAAIPVPSLLRRTSHARGDLHPERPSDAPRRSTSTARCSGCCATTSASPAPSSAAASALCGACTVIVDGEAVRSCVDARWRRRRQARRHDRRPRRRRPPASGAAGVRRSRSASSAATARRA